MVTNLNDDGPGSFRDAVKKKFPRIIVFAVSGTIDLKSELEINHGDVTIAGQSAPGDGICIRNYPVAVQADNVIIRYMRFRLGDTTKQEADALTGNKAHSNIIIDHCSISWATDECASFYRNKNFTMQWCIISESLNASVHEKGEHGYGGIWGGEGATFHHNLIASHTSRLPRFSGSASTPNSPNELVDFRNNVIYNWVTNSVYGGEKGRYNIVGNYYKPGPATQDSKHRILDPWKPYGQFYVKNNSFYNNEVITKKNRKGTTALDNDSAFVRKAFKVEKIHQHSPNLAFKLVLEKAGASHRRDDVDRRIVEEVREGNSSAGKGKKGIIDSQDDVGGWPELRTANVPLDFDGDGIPDNWEERHGLNSRDARDGTTQTITKGYDNIEIYLNELLTL